AAGAYTDGLKKAKDASLREKLHYRLGWVQYQREQFAPAGQTLLAPLAEQPRGELGARAAHLAGRWPVRPDQVCPGRPPVERLGQAKDGKDHERALYRAAACRAGLREWAASQKHYEELIRRFPRFKLLQEARYGLGWALQNQGKLDEARVIYEQVTKATS